MNPVRTLGPAIAAGKYRQLWIYLLTPTLGALVGAGVYMELTSRTLSIAIILKDLLIFIKFYRKRDTFFF
jgi:hypothetical protein